MNRLKTLITFLFSLAVTNVFSQATGRKTDFHQWAATPPLRWNSWDCFGPTVVEDEVKANADYVKQKRIG